MSTILKAPFFTQSHPKSSQLATQINWHFRFMVEYLHRLKLVDSKQGQTRGFAGILNHIHQTEPANFSFVALLTSEAIHKVCEMSTTNARQGSIDLLHVLAHILGREFVPSSDVLKLPTLPPLPKHVDSVLKKYDRMTIDAFTDYCKLYAEAELNTYEQDREVCTLPVSQQSFSAQEDRLPCAADSILAKLQAVGGAADADADADAADAAASSSIRSPFVATSGAADTFSSARSLTDAVRQDIHLEAAYIPVTNTRDVRGSPLKLNSYVLDFYTHGKYPRVLEENDMTDKVAWKRLSDWVSILRMMTEAMENLCELPDEDIVIKTFRYLTSRYTETFDIAMKIRDVGMKENLKQ